MGLLIKLKDAVFTEYVGYAEIIPSTYPITDNLKGLYYFGGTTDDCLVDHSGNENNATLKGGITVADRYASFTGSGLENRVDTPINIAYDSKITAVAMFRVPTGRRVILSNYYNNNGVVFTNNRVFTYINGSVSNKDYSENNNSENFVICAMSVDANSIRVVRDKAGSTVELLNYADGGIMEWTSYISIGGYRTNVNYNDDADIALVSIHEGDVTDTQLQQIFAYVRKYGEDNGLVID